MTVTPYFGWPVPNEDSSTEIWALMQALGGAIDAEFAAPDWQPLTLLPGFTGSGFVRKVWILVEIRFTINGSFPNGSTPFAQLPAGFAPAGNNARLSAWLPGHQVGVGYVETSGAVGVTHQTGPRTQVQGRGVWSFN